MGGTKRHILSFCLFCLCYGLILGPFVNYMHNKPYAEKLGVLPTIATLKFLSADQKLLIGSSLVMRVITYFGGLAEMAKNKIEIPPDFPVMSRTIHAAVKLDPYNNDAYYFAQSFLVWDVGQIDIANSLLIEGMRYRTWDWYLPYFVGFNYAYFKHDFKSAAYYYQKAAELSGQELHINLAGRFMQESGQIDHAISYLTLMAKDASNPVAKKTFETRLTAFKQVSLIEKARDRFTLKYNRLPESVDKLVRTGLLDKTPSDPYGGTFFLLPDGKVGTSSKFAFKNPKGNRPDSGATP